MTLPDVLLVDWSSSVPVVPSLTVTGEPFDDGDWDLYEGRELRSAHSQYRIFSEVN